MRQSESTPIDMKKKTPLPYLHFHTANVADFPPAPSALFFGKLISPEKEICHAQAEQSQQQLDSRSFLSDTFFMRCTTRAPK